MKIQRKNRGFDAHETSYIITNTTAMTITDF